ncbi:MAG TPA: hypothetical protein VIL33_04320 [Rhodothermia bacterium]
MNHIVTEARLLNASTRRHLVLAVFVAAFAVCGWPENSRSQSARQNLEKGRLSMYVSLGGLVHSLEKPMERRGFRSENIIRGGWIAEMSYRFTPIFSGVLLVGQTWMPSATRGVACGWVCRPRDRLDRSMTEVSTVASLELGQARFGIGPAWYSTVWRVPDSQNRDSKLGLLFDFTVGDSIASGLTAVFKIQYRAVGDVGIEVDGQTVEMDYDHFLLAIGMGYRL